MASKTLPTVADLFFSEEPDATPEAALNSNTEDNLWNRLNRAIERHREQTLRDLEVRRRQIGEMQHIESPQPSDSESTPEEDAQNEHELQNLRREARRQMNVYARDIADRQTVHQHTMRRNINGEVEYVLVQDE